MRRRGRRRKEKEIQPPFRASFIRPTDLTRAEETLAGERKGNAEKKEATQQEGKGQVREGEGERSLD